MSNATTKLDPGAVRHELGRTAKAHLGVFLLSLKSATGVVLFASPLFLPLIWGWRGVIVANLWAFVYGVLMGQTVPFSMGVFRDVRRVRRGHSPEFLPKIQEQAENERSETIKKTFRSRLLAVAYWANPLAIPTALASIYIESKLESEEGAELTLEIQPKKRVSRRVLFYDQLRNPTQILTRSEPPHAQLTM